MSGRARFAGALLTVTALAAACGPGHSVATPPSFGTQPSRLPGTSDHRACLDPRQPQTTPSSGWLPDTAQEAFDIGTGTPRAMPTQATLPPYLVTTIPGTASSPSTPAYSPPSTLPPSPNGAALAARFEAAAGQGFVTSVINEFIAGGCVIERDVRLMKADNGYEFLQILQLRRPFSPYSFPLGRDYRRQRLGDGSELLLADFDLDASRVTAIVVRPDGFLVRVVVASPHSTDVTGWPTTFPSPLPRAAHTPAALTLTAVAALAQSLVP